MKNLPLQLKAVFYGVIIILFTSFVLKVYDKGTTLFNQNKGFEMEYNSLCQKQKTNYDGYYQIFISKKENTSLNKDAFVEITNIIMSNRKDGKNLSWKWTQENQRIPFEEFTYFYKEISDIITERFKDNMVIEQSKQSIVKQQNLLISIYPNNIYNKFLKIPLLVYNEGVN